MRNPLKRLATSRKMIKDNGVYGFKAFLTIFDMIYCKKFLHCTYEEYFFYDFQKVKKSKRKNYLLRYHQRIGYYLVDGDPAMLGGKEQQYKLFADKIHREWICVKPDNFDEVKEFIKKHVKVIFKPIYGSQGKGIFSFSSENIDTRLIDSFSEIANKRYLCEQFVVQQDKIAELNPFSVNTMRIITLCNGEWVKIISAAIRIGGANTVCDNMSSGGIGAGIDIKTGTVFTTGVDFNKNRYDCHPITGKQIKGLEIPFWKETKAMVKECALRANKTAVVGWDVAITADGPILIEANNRPAGRLAQIAIGEPMGEEILDYIKNNWRNYYDKMPKRAKVLKKRHG